MKHVCMLISVADINAARKFYEDLFGLEVIKNPSYGDGGMASAVRIAIDKWIYNSKF